MSKTVNPQNPLLFPELFCCILEYVVTPASERLDDTVREQRQILAALARTCRAFSEPSLDLLWWRLDSLLPLIRCYSDIVDEARVQTPPSTSEWLVINRYSPRVRELTLGNEERSLKFLQYTGLVLPNLMVFRWTIPPRTKSSPRTFRRPHPPPHNRFLFDIACVWPLLTDKIITLEITLGSVIEPKYQLFLENYPHRCPNLKSVKLKFRYSPVPEDDEMPSQALSRAICCNSNWMHVELSPCIADDVLKHLGMSPTLKSVSLNLTSRILSGPAKGCFGPQDTPFTNVINLDLMLRDSFELATSLLRCRGQAFRSFNVTVFGQTFPREVCALLTALASPQRTHSLQSLFIENFPNMGSLPPPMHLSFETFRPLMSLMNLCKLVINLNHPTSLSDTEFAELVGHWPRLQVLKMTWIHGDSQHPTESMTLKALPSLLASCRDVREIALTLDARDVPEGEYAHADVCNCRIASPLTFQRTPITRPELVADFLMKHMPSLPGVRLASPCQWAGHSFMYVASDQWLWNQVNDRIGNSISL